MRSCSFHFPLFFTDQWYFKNNVEKFKKFGRKVVVVVFVFVLSRLRINCLSPFYKYNIAIVY